MKKVKVKLLKWIISLSYYAMKFKPDDQNEVNEVVSIRKWANSKLEKESR